jgi:lysozyme family protein
MKENFPASLAFVLRHECVYERGHEDDLAFVVCENVPGDAGGCTKFGIDAADHPGLDIRSLTLDQATAIYRDGEWTQCHCDDLPKGIDTAVFDCAVNNGVHVAGTLLQRALIASGHSVTLDGEIGPRTIAAAAAAYRVSKPDLIDHLLELRRRHYADIVLLHPGDGEFLHGWLNRVNDLEQFVDASAPNTESTPAAATA